MNSICSISDRAHHENWTSHQWIGVIGQDFANINFGIEHDSVSNTLNRGDESHSVATLSRMFSANETWFCIKTLLLAHIKVIQIYCVSKSQHLVRRQQF